MAVVPEGVVRGGCVEADDLSAEAGLPNAILRCLIKDGD